MKKLNFIKIKMLFMCFSENKTVIFHIRESYTLYTMLRQNNLKKELICYRKFNSFNGSVSKQCFKLSKNKIGRVNMCKNLQNVTYLTTIHQLSL